MPIAAGKGKPTVSFIQHLKREVESQKKPNAGAIFDFEWTFDGVLEWLLDNWQLVARIILGLIMFLDAAENE